MGGNKFRRLAVKVRSICFDRQTVALMREVLEDAWAGLSARQQAGTPRSILAERILLAAADGVRDPFHLRAHALALHPTVNDVGQQVRLGGSASKGVVPTTS
jgi:hypothetical protein